MIHCSETSDCLPDEQCVAIEPVYDDNDSLQSGVCAPKNCNLDGHEEGCITIGDACIDGSLQGNCIEDRCQYETAITLAEEEGCSNQESILLDQDSFQECETNEHCQFDQEDMVCHHVKNLKMNICVPYSCAENKDCFDLTDVQDCRNPILTGFCNKQQNICQYGNFVEFEFQNC